MITLTRTTPTGTEDYVLDVSWIVERKWPVITCAWHGDDVFPLTDAEIEELEARIYEGHEEECHGY